MDCPYLKLSDTIYCLATDAAYIPSSFELKEYCRSSRNRMCPFYRKRTREDSYRSRPRREVLQSAYQPGLVFQINQKRERAMKNILVVDDNKGIRDLLSFALTALLKDCEVRTAENGARAAEILASSPINAIMTDLSMPVMDGYQLIEWVRARSLRIPIIAMTGEADADARKRLASLGIERCFEKPFDLYDAVHQIESALGLSESVRTVMSAPHRSTAVFS